MTQQHHDQDGNQGIPLSAVYRQLDDQPAAEAAGYDPAATAARLMTRWAGSDPDTRKGKDATSWATELAPAMLSARQELILQLSHRRLSSTVWAYAAILGISGIAAAVAVLVTHLPATVLAGLAVTALLVSYAVVLIHRTAMHGMTADHGLLADRRAKAGNHDEDLAMRHPRPQWPTPLAAEDDEDETEDEDTWPDNLHSRPTTRPRSRTRGISAILTAPVLALIAYTSFHTGTAYLIALAATAGGAILTVLTLASVALFASERRSSRVFRLLAMLHGDQGAAMPRRVAERAARPSRGIDECE